MIRKLGHWFGILCLALLPLNANAQPKTSASKGPLPGNEKMLGSATLPDIAHQITALIAEAGRNAQNPAWSYEHDGVKALMLVYNTDRASALRKGAEFARKVLSQDAGTLTDLSAHHYFALVNVLVHNPDLTSMLAETLAFLHPDMSVKDMLEAKERNDTLIKCLRTVNAKCLQIHTLETLAIVQGGVSAAIWISEKYGASRYREAYMILNDLVDQAYEKIEEASKKLPEPLKE